LLLIQFSVTICTLSPLELLYNSVYKTVFRFCLLVCLLINIDLHVFLSFLLPKLLKKLQFSLIPLLCPFSYPDLQFQFFSLLVQCSLCLTFLGVWAA
jgi:hypothetical protein